MGTAEFKLEEKLMIADIKTVSFLLEQGNDVLALYFFYYKTAKLQKTNQVRATELFCRTGLHLGVKRFRAAQAILKKYNLIEIIKRGDKWYISINYLKTNSAKSSLVDNEPNSAKKELVASGTQMLKTEDRIRQNAFTVTNVTGGLAKKPPSCPLLNGSPLKAKYPKGHTECVEYILGIEEARGRKFINLAKQYQILHRTLKAGYDFTELDKAIRAAEKKYGEWNFDLTTLAAFLEKGINART